MISLLSIFNRANVKSSLISNEFYFVTPIVTYDLTAPIRSKIFNFNNLVLDVDLFLANPTIFPCDCEKSIFVGKDHGHILTRDLRIMRNNKLRKII